MDELEHLRARLRRHLDEALTPLARVLMAWRVTPNQVSVAGLALSVAAAALIVGGELLLGGLLFAVASTLDALDGLVARLDGTASALGAFLDSTLDRVSEGLAFAAIAYHFAGQGLQMNAALVVVALLGSLLVSYTRARAEGLGLVCKVGLMTRAERVALLVAGLCFDQLAVVIYLLVVLTGITVAQRVLHTWRELRPS